MTEFNPYAAPKALDAESQRVVATDEAPPLWNPSAAVNWSILFSPVFGSYLHMLNWRAIGDGERAASARTWFVVSVAVLGVNAVLGVLMDNVALTRLSRVVGLAFLITWYYSNARAQITHVKATFGTKYPRRPWSKPLLVGFGMLFSLFMLGMVSALLEESF